MTRTFRLEVRTFAAQGDAAVTTLSQELANWRHESSLLREPSRSSWNYILTIYYCIMESAALQALRSTVYQVPVVGRITGTSNGPLGKQRCAPRAHADSPSPHRTLVSGRPGCIFSFIVLHRAVLYSAYPYAVCRISWNLRIPMLYSTVDVA